MALTKTDFIRNVYNEPVINAVITELKYFRIIHGIGEHLYFQNIRIGDKSIHLVNADGYEYGARDIRIVLDSSDTITLKEFTTELNRGDLHLSNGVPYYHISDKELERICEASSIQFLGYHGNERIVDFTNSPSAFRAYYTVIVDERKYINQYHGLSPEYFDFWNRLSGRIMDFKIK